MAAGPAQRPVGVGAYSRGAQPQQVPEDYAPPLEDRPVPPGSPLPRRPPMGRLMIVVIALLVVLLVVVAVGVIGAFVITVHYPEQQSLTISAADNWAGGICIPMQSDQSSTNVSFTWATTSHTMVQLLAVPFGMMGLVPPIYNVTAASGSGWYGSGPSNDGEMGFFVFGAPTLPGAVNISLSYTLVGHYFGGPSTVSNCVLEFSPT